MRNPAIRVEEVAASSPVLNLGKKEQEQVINDDNL